MKAFQYKKRENNSFFEFLCAIPTKRVRIYIKTDGFATLGSQICNTKRKAGLYIYCGNRCIFRDLWRKSPRFRGGTTVTFCQKSMTHNSIICPTLIKNLHFVNILG